MSIPTEAKLPEGAIEVDMSPGGGKIPDVTDGLHDAVLVDIGTMASAFNPGKEVTVLRFCVNGHDRERDGTLNITPGRTAKSRFPWTTVLTALKVAHTPGQKVTISREELVGKPVKLLVANEPGTKDPSRKFPRVKALVAVA